MGKDDSKIEVGGIEFSVRMAILIAFVGVVVIGGGVAAFQMGLFTDTKTVDEGPMVKAVPDDANGLLYVDSDLFTDDVTQELFETGSSQTDSGTDYQKLVSQLQENTSLDINKFNSATVYFNSGLDVQQSQEEMDYLGILVNSEWDKKAFIETIESEGNITYDKGTHKGKTLYIQSETKGDSQKSYIGVLENGKYVFGTEKAVKDSIEALQSSEKRASGPLVDHIENRDGMARFAYNLPEETDSSSRFARYQSQIELMSGSYDTKETDGKDSIQVEVGMEIDTKDNATTLQKQIDGLLATGTQYVENETIREQIDAVKLTQDGARVTMKYETSLSEIEKISKWLESDITAVEDQS